MAEERAAEAKAEAEEKAAKPARKEKQAAVQPKPEEAVPAEAKEGKAEEAGKEAADRKKKDENLEEIPEEYMEVEEPQMEEAPGEKRQERKRPSQDRYSRDRDYPRERRQPVEERHKKKIPNVLLFNRWDVSGVQVKDPGLKRYINADPIIIPRSEGHYSTNAKNKKNMCIFERFINKLMVPGHRGRKHKITSGSCSSKNQRLMIETRKAFEIIEKKTGKNPLQVLVDAVENAAMLEEIAAYRMGGMIARKAVVVSPQRRCDLALRYLTQGIYKSKFRGKRKLCMVIADELMAAAANDPKNFAIQERMRVEKEAEGAR